MELQEGTADYASWTLLYDLGQTSRERLIQKYQAVRNDVFYLTGAMQLHAVHSCIPAAWRRSRTRSSSRQLPRQDR